MSVQQTKKMLTLFEQEGVAIEVLRHTKHITVRAEYRSKSRQFTLPFSASCYRAFMNFRGEVRRWKREVDDAIKG